MLDEKALRKPSFQPESNPVVLADGQTWWLAKPSIRLRPSFSGGHAVSVKARTTWGDAFDEMVESVESNTATDSFNAILNLGAFMLSQNYNLTDGDLEDLFVVTLGDEPSGVLSEIMSTARGEGPKRSPDGNA